MTYRTEPDEITNSEDIIDSRDVIARIEWLEEKETAITDAKVALTEAEEAEAERKSDLVDKIAELEASTDEAIDDVKGDAIEELREQHDTESDELTAAREAVDDAEADFNDDEREELKLLRELAEEGEGLSDWRHGETLIRESYFEDYARELASDLYGEEIDGAHWPFTCIDWERAASELEQDYTSIEFGDVTYLARG